MIEKPPGVEVGKEEKKGKRRLHFSYPLIENVPLSSLITEYQLARQSQRTE